MLTIVIVEDDEGVAHTVKEEIENELEEVAVHIAHFKQARSRIASVRPDVVVLDIYQGPVAQADAAGNTVWDEIWRHRFCPVIVYTAGDPDLEPSPPENHPFLQIVQKGSKSTRRVVECLREFQPHIDALRNVHAETETVIHSVLRDVAGPIFAALPDEEKRQQTLVRATRRRVAAMMDERTLGGGEPLLPWEQFLVPPIGTGPLMGDVLREFRKSGDDPRSYRVIVTPSCDMVAGRTKVGEILVARCGSPADFVEKGANITLNTGQAKKKQKLGPLLTQPEVSGYFLLPDYPGVTPLMSVNLRDLELVAVKDIGNPSRTTARFHRIASIDSPFREQAAWAYLQVACRPGLPDRDMSGMLEALANLEQD
ncbi:MAG: hypothetical protein L0387_22915 [Acidobacteria bacterium]|nr:hypothetical protein [Acidobacteriota bacterium]